MSVSNKSYLAIYRTLQTLFFPFWLLPFLSAKRRRLFKGRFFPPPLKWQGQTFWVHTLSVGEAQAARGLLEALKRSFPEKALLLSVTTATGFQFASRELSPLVDGLFPAPVDLWPVVHAFCRRLKPQAYILVETDVWPQLLWRLKQSGTRLFLVNGALSVKAYQRLKKIPTLARFLYEPFDRILAASPDDEHRFTNLLPNQVISFLGNLKFDLSPPSKAEIEKLAQELKPYLRPPIIVCGSTHLGEEELLLEAYAQLGRGSLLLCPRHPQRAEEICSFARQKGFQAALRSCPEDCDVLVVDTLGELRHLYGLAEVAFVGGTLVPIGGHNLLEPASLGVPLVFGPYVESVRNQADEFLQAGAGIQVKPNPQAIAKAWAQALRNQHRLSSAAKQVFKRHGGVTKRLIQTMRPLLEYP